MIGGRTFRSAIQWIFARLWREDRGPQLAEFAIALPLLVFFVVGIFDFSSAFTLKQKLTNVARDAARAAAAAPSSDLLSPSTPSSEPVSVLDAFQLIDNYLAANNLSDCGVRATGAPAGLTWTFSASGGGGGCTPPGVKIIINRGYYVPATGAALPQVTCAPAAPAPGTLTVVATCVSIQYAYPWRFGRVANLLGTTDILPTQISATAIAFNEN